MPRHTKTQRDRISDLMDAVGACYANSNKRFVGADDSEFSTPAYHIHPDRATPHFNAILRFSSLAALERYLRVRVQVKNAPTEDAAAEIWERYNAS